MGTKLKPNMTNEEKIKYLRPTIKIKRKARDERIIYLKDRVPTFYRDGIVPEYKRKREETKIGRMSVELEAFELLLKELENNV